MCVLQMYIGVSVSSYYYGRLCLAASIVTRVRHEGVFNQVIRVMALVIEHTIPNNNCVAPVMPFASKWVGV